MWGFGKTQRAMEAADGVRPCTDLDPGTRAEVERFRDLSGRVRRAVEPDVSRMPGFDAMWAGVEQRVDAAPAASRAADPAGAGWLDALLGKRPFLVLAPAGAMLIAAALGWALLSGGEAVDNRCFVDSYEAEEGSVLIDQDLDDPDRPTVIWHLEEG